MGLGIFGRDAPQISESRVGYGETVGYEFTALQERLLLLWINGPYIRSRMVRPTFIWLGRLVKHIIPMMSCERPNARE